MFPCPVLMLLNCTLLGNVHRLLTGPLFLLTLKYHVEDDSNTTITFLIIVKRKKVKFSFMSQEKFCHLISEEDSVTFCTFCTFLYFHTSLYFKIEIHCFLLHLPCRISMQDSTLPVFKYLSNIAHTLSTWRTLAPIVVSWILLTDWEI